MANDVKAYLLGCDAGIGNQFGDSVISALRKDASLNSAR